MVLILLSFLSLMVAVYICYHFTGSDSDNVIIPLTDGSCVYMFSFKEVVLIFLSFLSLMTAVYICYHFIGSISHIVIIPLTDGSCLYMFSSTGSGSHIVIIPLTDGSCVSVLFNRKWFSYCYHSSH